MKNTPFYKGFGLLLFFLNAFFLLRAQDHIQFKNYTINDGLSQSSISCVIQDDVGALWLGTQDGINHFNGKTFEIFSVDEGFDIVNDYINTGFKDSKGNIWFGTRNGLVKQDIKKLSFSSFYIDSIQNFDIFSITEDFNNNLWIGTSYGDIYRFNIKEEQLQLVDRKIFKTKIVDIKATQDKLIFVSEIEGILITDSVFKNQKRVKPLNKNFIINKLIDSPDYDIVIGTNRGIYYYNEKAGKLKPHNDILGNLKGINIVDVIYLSKNRLFAASESSGLYQLYKDENDSISVLNYTSDIFQKGSLISNRLTGLFKDKQGVIWIMSQQGLSSFNPQFIGFKGVGLSAYSNNGLPSTNVWSFDESENKRYLYIGGDYGVTSYDRINHKYHHYFREAGNRDDYNALSILVIDKNKLLVGFLDGIFELNINSNDPSEYEFIKIKNTPGTSLKFDFIYSIVPYKTDNKYLIGSKGGISILDYNTKEFNYLFHDSETENNIGQGACRLIFNVDDAYYTSPSSGGIYRIEYEDNQLKTYGNNDFTVLGNSTRNYISSIFQSDENIFWAGTIGDGLFKYDIKTKNIIHYDKVKGLPNNVVYGIEGTGKKSKYIWVSSNKGIAALNIKNNVFTLFTEKDGLRSNELNSGASFTSKSGEIYFGGIQGFNYFNEQDVFYINKNINVYFSTLEIDNEVVIPSEKGILKKSISFTDKIVLPYNKKILKLTFFADDLSNPEKIQYKYKLVGKVNVEEELGTSNQLRFTSLPPGSYELAIYAKVSNGNWNTHPAKLIIELQKPFWLKWWFYLISIFVLVITTFLLIRKRIDEGRRKQVRLEMKISERTRELRKKNDKIEQQKNKLVQQTIELEKEREKSERILNNVLPIETAKELKKSGRSGARNFKMVSIMFTDFVGFSRVSEKLSAKEVVSILDKHFSKFDEIIEENNIEKIKTIGDAYMCAGGVPIRDKTNPINTTVAAVQIKNYMIEYQKQQVKENLPFWELRIGINTGSVVAGVIGTKRYAYDIWGSAVNRAQRMEELCEPGKIAVTQSTFDYIEPYFECKEVGKVKTKSGLKIMMYEVVAIKSELSVDGLGIQPNENFHSLVNLHYYSKINYLKAERFILSKLKEELSPKLHYHSYDHSKDVTRQVERIAIGEGITDEDLFLLKSAASFHDAGFIEQYENNEKIGARMVEEYLPRFGYTEDDIKQIKELIYVTEVPHKPKNVLEQIICDADLDYLGREDFHEISDRLRIELREHGKINSDREWDKMQVKFFNLHTYFSKTSIETRREMKLKHLEEIKQRLKEDKYVD